MARQLAYAKKIIVTFARAFSSRTRRIRSATVDTTKSRCKPCFNADRAFKKATATQVPKRKVYLMNMVAVKAQKYLDHIMAFRIRYPDEPESSGVADIETRATMIKIVIDEVIEFESAQRIKDVVWMNRREFIGYHVTQLLYKKLAARKLWTRAKIADKVKPHIVDGQTCVPVRVPMRERTSKGWKR